MHIFYNERVVGHCAVGLANYIRRHFILVKQLAERRVFGTVFVVGERQMPYFALIAVLNFGKMYVHDRRFFKPEFVYRVVEYATVCLLYTSPSPRD